jgi:hypothetical protein
MRRRLAIGVVAVVIGVIGGRMSDASQPVVVGPLLVVHADRVEQVALVRWAVGRFEAAGLRLPSLEVVFHRGATACHGHVAFARGGRVDVCTVLVNATTRRFLLHEVAHVWLNANVAAPTRSRFLELRGAPSWNSSSDAWRDRGCEHAAEIIAWELGERVLTPSIDGAGTLEMASAYELLTGRPPPDA